MVKHLVFAFVLSSLACRSAAESGEKFERSSTPRVYLEIFTEQVDFFSSPASSSDQGSTSPSSQNASTSEAPVAPSIEPIATDDEGIYLRNSNPEESQSDSASSSALSGSYPSGYYADSERVLLDPSEISAVTDESFMQKIKLILDGVNPDCRLHRGTYLLSGKPQTILGMTYVTLAKQIEGCPHWSGFVYNRDVRLVKAIESNAAEVQRPTLAAIPIGKKTACEFSWEEKPGTTDYTTWDSYLKRTYSGADRSQSESLQGSKMLQAGNNISVMCANAKILKSCFEKANSLASSDRLSIPFFDWAKSRGVNPVRLRMAIAMKETHLGGLSDSCSGSSCNGVGLNQVITIVTDSGTSTNSTSRPEWPGITHNILTNMKYGMRVLALKVKSAQPQSIWELAKYYNGSSTSASYASAVVKHYESLSSQCGL